jgi:uncharacterized protein YcaQ
VTGVRELTRRDAQRIAVRAQLLARPLTQPMTLLRPTGLLEVVRHLGLLQADPCAAVAPSAELVVWSRLGADHHLGDLEAAEASGQLVELHGYLRPAEDIALYRAEMAAWPGKGPLLDWQESRRDWVVANDHTRRDIQAKLYDEGPLPASELPDTTVVPWESTGWNNDRNIRMLLDLLVARGEVAAAGHDGRERLWDLAERVYPDDPVVPLEEAARLRDVRRLRALGIARARSTKVPGEPNHVGETGGPAVVEGVRGTWRVDPDWLDPFWLDQPFEGRVALLSPIDRLVMDRKRMTELFGFDYQLEMFKPAAKRRWGYWAMPILDGDELVGKLDATADRDRGVLRVDAVHEDGEWSTTRRASVDREIEALALFLGLEVEVTED